MTSTDIRNETPLEIGAAPLTLVGYLDVTRHGRYGASTGQVKERLGSLKSERAVSLISIHAREIPHVFPREALAEAAAARPADLGGHEDWRALRQHCERRGIGLIGDIPIFVAHDRADVWQHRAAGLFCGRQRHAAPSLHSRPA